ncbi:choice-of-anchor M domain-containing protein [Kibdelosporangium persicum]|uniref:tRNA-dihydrouridine synthase n=1 Tax=Kibdelosporangium persicum TaxID=2698649 RepID=A0ABX2FDM0_9PSEU|nr:choice-of-anchor M domain-containing protein [Kibdelosporangium persicum]NRN69460.1 tRNA-dihydrouridine synthase [Kibdelosporangium persicum]
MRPFRPMLLLGAATAMLLAPAAATAQPGSPPSGSPSQRIDSGQAVTTDQKALTTGHVDIGPKMVDGKWTLMVHDDSTDPSVWRHLDRTVFRISDKAVLPVPDNPAYSFIGAPGKSVHVVPQVQNPDVVWVGWNTQDPEVMDTIDGGVTLTLTGVDGPGELFVYLQAGNFGAADVLWDSTKDTRQDIWVEVNTHTHANWVFTEPGVYLVRAEVKAELVDGRTVTDTQTLRFAIGDATSTDAALAAAAAAPPAPSAQAAAETPPAEGTGSGSPLLVAVIGAAALALAAGIVVVVMRGRSAKKRALGTEK